VSDNFSSQPDEMRHDGIRARDEVVGSTDNSTAKGVKDLYLYEIP
jgi:hypothetical protein